MDENKRKKLHAIGYTIQPCCGTCRHSSFLTDENFGECTVHTYEHLKHSGGRRLLSVFKFGYCSAYQQDPDVETIVHGFKEFIK